MDVETTLYICLEVLIALLSVVGNTLVCYVIMQSTALRKKVMYMFVTSLAIADICVGLFAIPFSILTKLGLPHSSPHTCIAMLSFIMVPTQISIFNMMAIAIERYLAIRHARIHYTKLTLNRSLYVIAVTWMLSVFMGMLPLLGWNNINSNENRYVNGTTTDHSWTTVTTFEPTWIEEFKLCEFMKVMDFDYMFFNFVVCVLPPLLTSAVLYSIIFFSFLQATKTKFTTEVRSPIYATGMNGRETHADSTPVSSPPFRNGFYSGTGFTSNIAETEQIPKLPESGHEQLQSTNGTNITQKNAKRENRVTARNSRDELNNITKPICLANIRVEVESPSSSAPTMQTYDVRRNQSFTSLQSSKRSMSVDTNTEVDTRLLKVRLEKLEKQINDPDSSVVRESLENGKTQTSGYNSANSSASSSQMRSRSETDCSERTKRRHREQRQKKRKREFKAAAVLCLIVLCFAICWMPIHMLNTIHRFDLEGSIKVPAALYSVAILLSHANSCVNFFLYSWRLRAFREQLKRLVLDRCFTRRLM